MQNNHSKNGTIFKTCHGGTLAAVRISRVSSSSTSISTTAARASRRRTPLSVRRSTGASPRARKLGDGPLGRHWLHARQNHSPLRRLQDWPEGACPAGTPLGRSGPGGILGDVDHINPIRQCRVQPLAHLRRSLPGSQREAQVLSLARHTGRGAARIGDLRVRREPGRVSDRQSCPAHSPLEGARHVPVAGKTHLSPLSIPDHQMLHRRQLVAAGSGHATSRPLREAAASRRGAPRSGPPGSRYPWPGRPHIHNTESSGNLPPRPRPRERWSPASPARASRGQGPRPGDPRGAPHCNHVRA